MLWIALLALPALASDALTEVTLAPATGVVGFRAYGMGLLPLDGQFTRFQGTLFIDPGRHDVCRVALRVEVASLAMSTDSLRDDVLGPDFLDSARYPVLSYDGTCGADGLDGALTMHGVTRPFTLALEWDKGDVVAVGRLRRADWGMTAMPVLGGSTVRITVSVHLAAPRRAGP